MLIQFGAILALLTIYFTRLWKIALGMFTNADDRRFVIGLLIAFLPAGVIGALLHGFIKGVLFNVWIVCISLIIGGAVLIWIEKLPLRARFTDATAFPLPTYLMVGFFQCLAMIPGVSRSGATIVSAMLLGADRRSAAEFSFYLAMPTMAGAFAYELYKSWQQISALEPADRRGRIRRLVYFRLGRGEDVPRLRVEPRLCGVRLVAHRGRRARADRPRAGESEIILFPLVPAKAGASAGPGVPAFAE